MKVNYKQLYISLTQQKKALEEKLHPSEKQKANEIPDDFNLVGWDLTIEKLNDLITKLNQLHDVKGNRLTPQFYRSIYNRALIGINEADKLIEKLVIETSEIDYEHEVSHLNYDIVKLQQELDGQQVLEINE